MNCSVQEFWDASGGFANSLIFEKLDFMNEWFELKKAIVGPALAGFIVVAGWFFSNWLSKKKDIENKKRELITKHLIDSYRVIYNKVEIGLKLDIDLKKALYDVFLFGTLEQIDLLNAFFDELSKMMNAHQTEEKLKFGGYAKDKLVSLLDDLRYTLRSELNLDEAERYRFPVFFFND